jgi:hypothetical protein
MFVATAVAFTLAGCTQQYILRLSNPEQATAVVLFDNGKDEESIDDDKLVILDEPRDIAKVATFFESRSGQWNRLREGEAPPIEHYTIHFRKGDKVTDRFWFENNTLCLKSPDGNYYTCDISERERAQLLNSFRFNSGTKAADAKTKSER